MDIEPNGVQAIVPIANLSAVRIETESSPDGHGYTNTWTSTSGAWARQAVAPWTILPERTEGNFLALSEWYSVATYKTRITIAAGDQTLTCNRYGNPLAASLRITPSRLEVNTSGDIEPSDVSLESSQDNVSWITKSTIFTSSGDNIMTAPVSAVLPHEFFRVIVR